MGASFKEHPIGVAISVFAGLFGTAAALNDVYDFINLGLPNLVWAAIAGGACIMSLMAILIKQDQAIKRLNRSIEQHYEDIKQLREPASAGAAPAASPVPPQLPAEQQPPKGAPKLSKEHKASLLAEREKLVVEFSTYRARRSELQTDLTKQYLSSEKQAITQRIEDVSRDMTAMSERISAIDEMLRGG